jgi:hypothetical protein
MKAVHQNIPLATDAALLPDGAVASERSKAVYNPAKDLYTYRIISVEHAYA